MKEVYKDIVGYEGHYQVSNLGNVKSLRRNSKYRNSYRTIKEKILKYNIGTSGYYSVCLYKDNKYERIAIHQLVAIAFLNHKPNGFKLVVDHLNNIKTDNRLSNLQIVTNRENSSKDKEGYSSKYIGVDWNKNHKRWRARIYINGKRKYLGQFKTEEEANLAYQKELKTLNN